MSSPICLRLIHKNCTRSIWSFSNQFIGKKLNISPVASFHNINSQRESKSNVKLLAKKPLSNVVGTRSSSSDHTSHDHVGHWSAERVMTVLMASSIPVAIYVPAAEYFLSLALVLHAHWGIEGIVIDYIRPSIFGTVIPKVSVGAVYLLSAIALGGLFYFTYTDVGLINAVKLLWKV